MTAGGGGALLATGARGRQLLERARARIVTGRRGAGSLARLAAQALLSHPVLYGVPARVPWLRLGDTPFHEPWPVRAIAAAQAGVLEAAAGLADIEAGIRRTIALQIAAALEDAQDVALVRSPSGDGTQPGWLRYPVVLGPQARARSSTLVFRRLGIMPGYPRPLPELPRLAKRGAVASSWPGATLLANGLMTLPTHRWVEVTDIHSAVALLRV